MLGMAEAKVKKQTKNIQITNGQNQGHAGWAQKSAVAWKLWIN